MSEFCCFCAIVHTVKQKCVQVLCTWDCTHCKTEICSGVGLYTLEICSGVVYMGLYTLEICSGVVYMGLYTLEICSGVMYMGLYTL